MGLTFALSQREFPRSFRFPALIERPDLTLRVSCRCGAVQIAAEAEFEARHCHCPQCRRYACSALASYVVVPKDCVSLPMLSSFAHSCEHEGAVDRLACGRCRSKIAAIPRSRDVVLLAAGSVQVMPTGLARRMREMPHDLSNAAPWFAGKRIGFERPARGSCACGACAFTARNLLPGELQHCYCTICQRASGGPFQTWMPCSSLTWERSDNLELVRTTGHGRRHQCTRCAAVLTIVYDSQPHTIWPAAGAVDDACLPSPDHPALYRQIHICCTTVPPWYVLPDDNLPRLRYAC
ncbi:hypothetical protein CTAYLR_002402 [Chrysophaeum taylorii]|uniref:CENP-V/GFA domain-containing protein n=1 Tax=Chrysophaeum taylorii TaxID=2483200 RepID=A0AAD7XNA9_9STRA|nr:hypothetical protein CTAYLR_002402 [Chrysophaeum taylorii]